MTPPRDPILRAIYRVSHAAGLTPTERLAMLALWRYLGTDGKSIGPTLLADLICTTKGYAKKLLVRLRAKGYLKNLGRQEPGKCALRQLTGKVSLPVMRTKKRGTRRIPGGSAKRVPHGITDQGV